MALGILESLQESGKIRDLGNMKHNSAEYLHAVIESLRLAFEDSKFYVADPEVYPTPVKGLLSKDYLAKRADIFDPNIAKVDVEKGSPENSCDTFNPQVALDAPRIMIEPFNPKERDESLRSHSLVYIEEGIDENVIEELQKMGHKVKVIKEWKRFIFGRGQIIERRIDKKTGIRVWCGGSDLRGDGQAVGW
ncbi:1230_t:CDS:2 [Acaulospora colombiana]|uniref:1230_t:CDS:1 n=1 Tax=Acaulospora colombiana TaxID=27376 RepID=A0ACA9LTU0_9GLOM|nr:1230_t:CDS:2 [Acaulospora colombiana]